MRSRLFRAAACGLSLSLCALTSCATSHLLEWSRGEPSMYHQPSNEVTQAVVRPTGTVVALPLFFVWDVVTLPFQWIWGVYPYGGMVTPDVQDG